LGKVSPATEGYGHVSAVTEGVCVRGLRIEGLGFADHDRGMRGVRDVIQMRRARHTCPPLLLVLVVICRQWRGLVMRGWRWKRWWVAASERW
jgi:hypothetical protein